MLLLLKVYKHVERMLTECWQNVERMLKTCWKNVESSWRYAGNFTIYLAMFSYSGSDMMSSLNQNTQPYSSLSQQGQF